MSKLWLPDPVYEAKPYGALALGVAVAAASFVGSMSAGSWELPAVAGFVASCAVIVYGGVILQMRLDYRRSTHRRSPRR